MNPEAIMTRKHFSCVIAASLTLMGSVSSSASAAAAETQARRLLRTGGSLCLKFNPPPEWNLSAVNEVLTVKLPTNLLDRSDEPSSPVQATLKYRKTTATGQLSYTNELIGEAVLRSPNVGNALLAPKMIMEFQGVSRGVHFDAPAVPGRWDLGYYLELDPVSLAGTVHGFKTFTPEATTWAPSWAPVIPTYSARIKDMPVVPVTCPK